MTSQKLIAHIRKKDGKTQSILKHLTGVARRSAVFAKKIGLEQVGLLLGLLHDLGKYSKEFWRYIRSAEGMINPDEDDYVDASGMKGKIDHSTAGAQFVFGRLSEKGDKSKLVGQLLALCVASHHSGLIDCLGPDGRDSFSGRIKKPDALTHLSEAMEKLERTIHNKLETILSSQNMEDDVIKTLKKVHNDGDSLVVSHFKQGLLIRYLFSCLIDADRLDSADFEEPQLAKLRNNGRYRAWSVLISRLEKRLSKFTIRNEIDQLRREISDACYNCAARKKGLYSLTVPTGGGKTLASLRFALHHAREHGLDRIIYVIPYTSIIDQNAEEVRKFLEDRDRKGAYLDRVVLEHHSNLTPEEETYRQKILSQDWDAPVVFTTSAQVLETLFGGGTRNARRMHQLARSVLIFDEVQTLPLRCVHMFNNAVDFLINSCGSTVVLCTATQPLLDQVNKEFGSLKLSPDHQMMLNTEALFSELKRTEIVDMRRPGGWNPASIAELTLNELKTEGSVLIVMNTRKAAKRLYKELSGKGVPHLYHLSTNMCAAHRMQVLQSIRTCLDPDDPQPVICVSTQLIEAGVDVDFGSVIRSVAGLDSIAQAAGRCNRNGRRAVGRVFVINPDFENLDRLKDIRAGKEKAERLLDEYRINPAVFDNDLLGPKAMERYFQYYFYERADEMKYLTTSNSLIGRNSNLLELLSTNSISVEDFKQMNHVGPPFYFRQSFMSAAKVFQAIDSPARGIIVPYGDGGRIIGELCAAHDVKKQYTLLRQAQRHSVNIFPYEWQILKNENAIYEIQEAGIYFLDEEYYHEDFGLSMIRVAKKTTLEA
ncbi:MAG: helicase Cas3 [Syntrophorhabdus sp. PtaU1.Bin050]|nr:MAG: helicase Cas3 [Syntrophorhabdus sp. PtaU1.Bin050]